MNARGKRRRGAGPSSALSTDRRGTRVGEQRLAQGCRRPGARKVKVVTNLDPDTLAELQRMARRENCTVSEVIRTVIEWGLERAG
ncbi:ribbon-helix-helix protein, CopG family [Acuticoccus sediminis]|uniref:ribbon-helix-helix protein, CopG family n=1 Tax=Acuticoccus sediminis TaxID=2184697 RepID=UPI003CC8167F